MEWWLTLIVIFGSLILLLMSGLPVAFAFLALNITGAYIYWGGLTGIEQLVSSIYSSVTLFSLLPVPLFILMGEIMFRTGVAIKMLEVLSKWMGQLPGRLALLSVAAGVLFSTLSGSSVASTAMLGSLLLPDMEQKGYQRKLSLGSIMGSGGLATMIPPSALGVLLASLGQISVGDFLIAIIVPGIVMAIIYATYIVGSVLRNPEIAPSYQVEPTPLMEKIRETLIYILPLGTIIFLVIGVIILGLATPTEAAALGTIASLILSWLYGSLSWESLKESLLSTLHVTVMVFMIMTGSAAFSHILAFSGATSGLIGAVASLDTMPILVLIAMQLTVAFMGAFMEPLSIMMVVLPVFLPVAQTLGFNPLWFGVILLINLETATISPPFGTGLFAMKGVAPPDTTIGLVYRAAIPFVVCNIVAMAAVMIFPDLALWLPGFIQK